jgi:hypothetical protein
MSARISYLATLVLLAIFWPTPALACSCGGTISTVTAAGRADVVFVGTVSRIGSPRAPVARDNADGSISVESSAAGPDFVLFDVARVFKGPSVSEVGVLRGNSTCDFPFKTGEEWLVYGDEAIGGITTYKCSRTRLTASATQDLVYLRGADARRPQGILYGEVLRRRGGPDGVTLSGRFEPLEVIAANVTQKLTTATEPWGSFELVVPPGDFEVWVERREKMIAPKRVVHVKNGAEVKLQLLVEYSDAER